LMSVASSRRNHHSTDKSYQSDWLSHLPEVKKGVLVRLPDRAINSSAQLVFAKT
jgi:hypothetical protein